jgi:hypothetical protein
VSEHYIELAAITLWHVTPVHYMLFIIISALLPILFWRIEFEDHFNWRPRQSVVVQPSMHCKPASACKSCSLLLLQARCWQKAEPMQLCTQTAGT